MNRARWAAFSLGLVLVSATGCSPLPSDRDIALLNEGVAEFDAESLAPVVCEDSGADGLKPSPYQSLMLSNADSWQPMLDRLEELGYSGNAIDPDLSYRSDRFTVTAIKIESSTTERDIAASLEEKGCEIPPEGGVLMTFRARVAVSQ